MHEVELYNTYQIISVIFYIAGGLLLFLAVVLLLRGLGGFKELRDRLAPKPVMQKEENEEAQEHIQKVAEALEQGKVAVAPDLGTAVTAKLGEKDEGPFTTVLNTEIPATKFKVVKKIIITHER